MIDLLTFGIFDLVNVFQKYVFTESSDSAILRWNLTLKILLNINVNRIMFLLAASIRTNNGLKWSKINAVGLLWMLLVLLKLLKDTVDLFWVGLKLRQ